MIFYARIIQEGKRRFFRIVRALFSSEGKGSAAENLPDKERGATDIEHAHQQTRAGAYLSAACRVSSRALSVQGDGRLIRIL